MEKENKIKSIYNIAFKKYPDVLSVKELSGLLNISIKTAYKLLRTDKIKHIVIGNTYKIPKFYVLEYLNVD